MKSQKGQIEGIIRFYAASATCQGDKLKWTPTCQGTNCGARMFPGFLLNLSLFLSLAGGQLGVGPLRPASGMTLSPAGSGAVCQWQTSSTDRRGSGDQALNGAHWAPAPPEGGGETWLPLWGRYVPVGRCPAADRGGSRDAGTAAAVTERASSRDAVAARRLRGPTPSCPRAGDRKMRQLPKKLGFMRV